MAVLQGFVANKCSFSWEQTVVEKKRKMEKKEQKSFNLLTFSLSLFGAFSPSSPREEKKSGGFDGWMPNSFFPGNFRVLPFFSKGTFHLKLLYPIIPLGPISCYSMRNRIWRIYQTFLFCFLSTIIRQTEGEVEASERRRLIYWRARALSFSLLLPTPHFPFLFPLSVSLFFHFLYLILLFLIPSFPLCSKKDMNVPTSACNRMTLKRGQQITWFYWTHI